jgi:hypothetical protein|tara:strand:- start:176 stop:886 length:711 start_codon:yes stop_codon:yes gene_type:complete
MSIDVVCVKWGTEYSDEYVHILKAMVERNSTVPFHFKAFTDGPIEGIDCVPLSPGLNGWWNKLQLFNPAHQLSERIVYFDLDTVITKNIDFFLEYDRDFCGIENLGVNNKYENPAAYRNVFQSGVLAWNRNFAYFIWNIFVNQKDELIKNVRGDGELLHMIFSQTGRPVDLFQHLWPGKLKSYKYQIYENGLDDETAIICFHGTPRPHEAIGPESTFPWGVEFKANPWVADYWRKK